MSIRCLVVGGGLAGKRYVDAFLFDPIYDITICGFGVEGKSMQLSQKYALNYIDFSLLGDDINKYGLIIISVPLKVKYKILAHILIDLKYKNSIIIEKPLSYKTKEMQNYLSLLSGRKGVIIPYVREFDKQYAEFPLADGYNIVLSSFCASWRFNIIHMLPHFLEWVIRTGNSIEAKGFFDSKSLFGKLSGRPFSLEFSQDISGCYFINGVIYNNPSFMCNLNIASAALRYDCEASSTSLRRSEMIQRQTEYILGLLSDH